VGPFGASGRSLNSGSLDQGLSDAAVAVSITAGVLLFCASWMLRQATSVPKSRREHPVLAQLIERRRAVFDETPSPAPQYGEGGSRVILLATCLAMLSAFSGLHLAGPVAGLAGGAAGAWIPFARRRRSRQQRRERLDEQFAEYAEATAMAVRGGLSIRRAMDSAAEETEEPLAPLLHGVLRDHRLGSSFDRVLDRLAEELPTNETRLLTLVLRLHTRSGGNLAESMDEVASSIRRRVMARRDLHALSAQGRMSGAILALLPIVFFVVLAASSRSDVLPILHSSAGIALVSAGLALQGLGYVWIRRLLRVRV
jgi:tight adherence protein B